MAEGQKPRKQSEESVKLFVGQVPKHMTEAQLMTLFKEFAIVEEVNIIKDKTTRASRGSLTAFITSSNLSGNFLKKAIFFTPDRQCAIRALVLFRDLPFN